MEIFALDKITTFKKKSLLNKDKIKMNKELKV